METNGRSSHARECSEAKCRRASIDVYDADFSCCIIGLPNDKVFHVPHRKRSEASHPYVLCRAFLESSPHACPMGDTCAYVHADIVDASKRQLHVNYAWRSLALVSYARLPAGKTLCVAAPNNRKPLSNVPSEMILETVGSLAAWETSDASSHCAHFYFNRYCNRGTQCRYMHVLTVDATAADGQWARPPTSIGPGEETNSGKECKSSRLPSWLADAVDRPAAKTVVTAESVPSKSPLPAHARVTGEDAPSPLSPNAQFCQYHPCGSALEWSLGGSVNRTPSSGAMTSHVVTPRAVSPFLVCPRRGSLDSTVAQPAHGVDVRGEPIQHQVAAGTKVIYFSSNFPSCFRHHPY